MANLAMYRAQRSFAKIEYITRNDTPIGSLDSR